MGQKVFIGAKEIDNYGKIPIPRSLKLVLLYPPKFKTDECLEEIADEIISYKDLKDLQEKLRQLWNKL